MTERLCACGCGRPFAAGPGNSRPRKQSGLREGCYQRWVRAGRPDHPVPPGDPRFCNDGPCRAGCGEQARACGYCRRCYERWHRAGRPQTGPPPPTPRSARVAARNRAFRAARLEDYADLRSWGVPVRQAAMRVGVTLATAAIYEAEIREQSVAA